jgi:hypothetical protein
MSNADLENIKIEDAAKEDAPVKAEVMDRGTKACMTCTKTATTMCKICIGCWKCTLNCCEGVMDLNIRCCTCAKECLERIDCDETP